MVMVSPSQDSFYCVSEQGVLSELGLGASAVLAHTLHEGKFLRVADAGRDVALSHLACPEHSAVLTAPIRDQANVVAGVLLFAGKRRGEKNTFFSDADLSIVQTLVRRIEIALDHVITRQATCATMRQLAVSEKSWQRLQHGAALQLHSQAHFWAHPPTTAAIFANRQKTSFEELVGTPWHVSSSSYDMHVSSSDMHVSSSS
jgi:GAF domain-containing protein